MRPLRDKRQQYGGDPTIEITRPEPIRVRHQEPAKISGKRTTLGQMIFGQMTFTTAEVHQITGSSMRQLQRWDEHGWMPCRKEGQRRIWSQDAIRKAELFAAVSRSGSDLLPRLARLSDAVFKGKYFLFRSIDGFKGQIPQSLIGVTNDRAEVIRIATEAKHGVMLVEIPNE